MKIKKNTQTLMQANTHSNTQTHTNEISPRHSTTLNDPQRPASEVPAPKPSLLGARSVSFLASSTRVDQVATSHLPTSLRHVLSKFRLGSINISGIVGYFQI